MQLIDVMQTTGDFDVAATTERSQGATMVLGPGQKTGGPDNRHEGSDQWMVVLRGRGRAFVQTKELELQPGRVLLIEAGETHEIRCEGDEPLITWNVYARPAYPSS